MKPGRYKRGAALLLAAALISGNLWTGSLKAQAEDAAEPDNTVYATRMELQSKYDLDNSTPNKTMQKVYFGYNGKGSPQVWKIAGKDTRLAAAGDSTKKNNIVLFADTPMGSDKEFGANNDYRTSTLYTALREMETKMEFFSTSQQALMNKTTIKTKHYDGGTYSTTGVLYAAYGEYDSTDYQRYITVGTNGTNDLNDGLRIDLGYWGDKSFWLRAPAMVILTTRSWPGPVVL